jgi:Uncharacterized protein conserved in bacteria (DUF2252)
VGDLHIENFGTWRDRDARLVWGVNDFDELDLLPYTIDLVRLATSALLAIAGGHLALDAGGACVALLSGWRERLELGAAVPFVLGEEHQHLYRLAAEAITRPRAFARRIQALESFDGPLPKPAARLLARAVPFDGWQPTLRRRVAGVGSLGSRRIVALGSLDGGLVVRELKQIPGPASSWRWPRRSHASGGAQAVARMRGVSADPWRGARGRWVVRALSSDATRLELTELRRRHDEKAILQSMGAEAANVHMVSAPGVAPTSKLCRDADRRPEGWLLDTAEKMKELTERDWVQWRALRTPGG